MAEKLIMTIDLDAFFASCEELRHPEVKGQPMVVGFELNGRGIASTANYAARKFGIKSGMPLFKVRKLVPNVIVITPDHDYYQKLANEVFNIVHSFSEIIEVASIDECFVDFTKLTTKYKPLEIAKMVKDKIYKETNLVVSIGMSTNLFLSKQASGIDKPNGITTLWKHEIKDKLWPLNIGELYMVGKKSKEKFEENGILTIGDLANLKNDKDKYTSLKRKMGINLDKLILEANGELEAEIDLTFKHAKSISKEETFGSSLTTIDEVLREGKQLFEKVFNRKESRKLNCSSVSVSLKVDKSFKRNSMSKVVSRTNNDKNSLWGVIYKLLNDLFVEGMSVKQVAIEFSGLKEGERTYKQLTLEDNNENTPKTLQDIANEISWQSGEEVVSGETMENNKRYEKTKLINKDNIKFKVWDD